MPAAERPSPILRNLLAVLAGFVIGSLVNMGIIKLGGQVFPPPGGSAAATMEGLQASMHLFGPQHFVAPWLAHAFGTLAGAFAAARIAASRTLLLAMTVGALFFAGGVAAVAMLPAPLWFEALDLALAYFPMAWIGCKLGARRAPSTP